MVYVTIYGFAGLFFFDFFPFVAFFFLPLVGVMVSRRYWLTFISTNVDRRTKALFVSSHLFVYSALRYLLTISVADLCFWSRPVTVSRKVVPLFESSWNILTHYFHENLS